MCHSLRKHFRGLTEPKRLDWRTLYIFPVNWYFRQKFFWHLHVSATESLGVSVVMDQTLFRTCNSEQSLLIMSCLYACEYQQN